MIFAYFFTLPSLITFYTITVQFLPPGKHLIGFMVQVKECRYSIPVQIYVL